jgi:membrane protease YdiL (CAAX protease family)
MSDGKYAEKKYTLLYSVLVLAVTWIISVVVFGNPRADMNSMPTIMYILVAVAMFIPAILAFAFKRIQYRNKKANFLFSIKKLSKKAILFSILYPISFVFVCAAIAIAFNIGVVNYQKIPDIKGLLAIVGSILGNMIMLLGEEYGWRGYLLPELTKNLGKLKATMVVGIVWALYHVPSVYLMAKMAGMSNALLLCVIQAAVVFAFSFPFSYCYYLSDNLIPVLLMHSIWNEVNAAVLGNISSKETGLIQGNLLYINGEGILGFILGAIMISWFLIQFKKNNSDLLSEIKQIKGDVI